MSDNCDTIYELYKKIIDDIFPYLANIFSLVFLFCPGDDYDDDKYVESVFDDDGDEDHVIIEHENYYFD